MLWAWGAPHRHQVREKRLFSHNPPQGHSPRHLKTSHKASPLKVSSPPNTTKLRTRPLTHGPWGGGALQVQTTSETQCRTHSSGVFISLSCPSLVEAESQVSAYRLLVTSVTRESHRCSSWKLAGWPCQPAACAAPCAHPFFFWQSAYLSVFSFGLHNHPGKSKLPISQRRRLRLREVVYRGICQIN
jgi:hypothetical protein